MCFCVRMQKQNSVKTTDKVKAVANLFTDAGCTEKTAQAGQNAAWAGQL